NLWMQHLENMDHLREGVHWMSVGQRDPLVEYRRQGQRLFEEMQVTLRHDVVRALFHAQPVDPEDLEEPIETELTRAARRSTSNIDAIQEGDAEFREADFKGKKESPAKKKLPKIRKKAHKAERQRKAKGRKHK
ncbi:MAG TPA: preprotein translocase subunit SecA, partial [Candidatus Saccharimonadales bacterium]|nr:preprotein translocase subunit SecA [Candidatus Saccharimonadales bacterium]